MKSSNDPIGNRTRDLPGSAQSLNQLRNRMQLITESDKAALYHLHYATFTLIKNSTMALCLLKKHYFINQYKNTHVTFCAR
jgi:hypothetical protein